MTQPHPLIIWEDDFGSVEVLPSTCYDWCLAELRAIRRSAEAHRAPDGLGWTDVYLRGPPPQTLAGLSLDADRVTAVFAGLLTEVTPLSGDSVPRPKAPIPNTRAFVAKGGSALVVYRHPGTGLVGNIDLIPQVSAPEIGPLLSALTALPEATDLILVDWTTNALFHLNDETTAGRYRARYLAMSSPEP